MRHRHLPRPSRLAPFALLCLLAGCETPPLQTQPPAFPQPAARSPAQPFFSQTGIASFYGAAFHGKTTAGGDSFDQNAFTAAHRSLAFGTVVRVTNLGNGKTVKVEINDRGPHVKGRIVDLSLAAARALDMKKDGITQVRLEAFRADQSAD